MLVMWWWCGDAGSRKVVNQVLNKKSKTTHVPSLNVDGKIIVDNEAIAESMNDFFFDSGKKLNDKIPATLSPLLANECSVNKENSKFHFTPVDKRQVEKVFGKLNSSMGSGHDGIANFFLKAGLLILAESHCNIVLHRKLQELPPYSKDLFWHGFTKDRRV